MALYSSYCARCLGPIKFSRRVDGEMQGAEGPNVARHASFIACLAPRSLGIAKHSSDGYTRSILGYA